jgi:hypothetical protein
MQLILVNSKNIPPQADQGYEKSKNNIGEKPDRSSAKTKADFAGFRLKQNQQQQRTRSYASGAWYDPQGRAHVESRRDLRIEM